MTRPLDGAIAQLGERLNGIQEVVGSIPIGSTRSLPFPCLKRSSRARDPSPNPLPQGEGALNLVSPLPLREGVGGGVTRTAAAREPAPPYPAVDRRRTVKRWSRSGISAQPSPGPGGTVTCPSTTGGTAVTTSRYQPRWKARTLSW